MHAGKAPRHLVCGPTVPEEEVKRDPDTRDGEETRDGHQCELASRTGGGAPGGNGRREEVLEAVRYAGVTGDDRADGGHDQGDRHRRRLVVKMCAMFLRRGFFFHGMVRRGRTVTRRRLASAVESEEHD